MVRVLESCQGPIFLRESDSLQLFVDFVDHMVGNDWGGKNDFPDSSLQK